jgi:UDP-N-acetylmuramyl pentapeptide synthase
MRELGDYTEVEHKKIAELVKSFGYPENNVFFLGQYFKFFRYGSKLKSIEEVTSLIEGKIKSKGKAVFLLKGSHGTELYKVAELFAPSNISS